jgi:sterol desaturase/sphingolipid hydroxylase (fatty acid hydroxylase superfamily)
MEQIAQFQISAGKLLLFLFLSTLLYGIAEFLFIHFAKRVAKLKEYRTTFFAVLFVIGISIAVTMLYGRINTAIIGIWAWQFSWFKTDLSWYWWIYGWAVYEFFYWVQHYLAHKVRLFWCLHSPHHAPESMNMFVGFNHSFLESIFYMPFFLGFFPAILGVNPIIIIVMNMVDAIWGSMIHISDQVMKSNQLGVLEKILQTPAYHRAHHAKNVVYMDTNYCSITLFWDWLLGTLQPLKNGEPPMYGITREVKTGSFWDVHFGEFRLLFKDIYKTKAWRDKINYCLMPPGWSHTGEGNTTAQLKEQLKMEVKA